MTDTPILRSVQLLLALALAAFGGLAACLSLWVVPVILVGTSPRTRANQFVHTFTLGQTYLQPSSRFCGILTLILTGITALHPNPQVSQAWKYYVACACLFLFAAVYEIQMIFPINDRAREMAVRMNKDGEEALSTSEKGELEKMIKKWQVLHIARIVTPLLAAVISLGAVI